MKNPKNKEDLIEIVVNQIREDFQYGEFEPLYELLKFLPAENLINYLPESRWEQIKKLENA